MKDKEAPKKSPPLMKQTRDPSEYPVTKDTPLSLIEQKFLKHFLECGIASEAMRKTGVPLDTSAKYAAAGLEILKQPNVKAEIAKIMDEIRKDTVATADEVMQYFTSVMRGELKDQFGLDAALSERTKAAQEIAKRTIDLENKKSGLGENIAVTINWNEDSQGGTK